MVSDEKLNSCSIPTEGWSAAARVDPQPSGSENANRGFAKNEETMDKTGGVVCFQNQSKPFVWFVQVPCFSFYRSKRFDCNGFHFFACKWFLTCGNLKNLSNIVAGPCWSIIFNNGRIMSVF